MQKCFVVAHYHQDTIYVCLVQIKCILRNSWEYQWWMLYSILRCIFYYFIVLDTVCKCPDCKKRDIWQNRRSSDYPLPCLCQRRHHILWCFKRGHLRLERAHPGPNHSRGTQCEYCRMGLWGGVLNTLGPRFSMFLPSALQSEDVTKQLQALMKISQVAFATWKKNLLNQSSP